MGKTDKNRKQRCDLVVVGASAGGVEALQRFNRSLPEDLHAAICIVLHVGVGPSSLPEILTRSGKLPAVHPEDNAKIEPGRIYVAPPNLHMLVKPGHLRLIMGPKEDFFRPAINPLFRTAASAYRERVIGVILSGAQKDGALGLRTVKQYGGVTIAQNPEEALVPSMPMNAIRIDDIDYVLKISQMVDLIAELSSDSRIGAGKMKVPDVKVEPDILELSVQEMRKEAMASKPTDITCPECGGVIWEKSGSGIVNYRCYLGHGFSGGVVRRAKSDAVESAIWNTIRTLEEKEAFLRRMVGRKEEIEGGARSEELLREANETRKHTKFMRKMLDRIVGAKDRKG